MQQMYGLNFLSQEEQYASLCTPYIEGKLRYGMSVAHMEPRMAAQYIVMKPGAMATPLHRHLLGSHGGTSPQHGRPFAPPSAFPANI